MCGKVKKSRAHLLSLENGPGSKASDGGGRVSPVSVDAGGQLPEIHAPAPEKVPSWVKHLRCEVRLARQPPEGIPARGEGLPQSQEPEIARVILVSVIRLLSHFRIHYQDLCEKAHGLRRGMN